MFNLIKKDAAGNYTLDKEEFGLIKEFKILLDRDKGSWGEDNNGKKIELDEDGRLKKQTLREFCFIWNYCSVFSPYSVLSDGDDKLIKCMQVSQLNVNFRDVGRNSTWNRTLKGVVKAQVNVWDIEELYNGEPIILNAIKRFREIQDLNSPTIKSYFALKRFIIQQTAIIELSEQGAREIIETVRNGYTIETNEKTGASSTVQLSLVQKATLRDLARKEMDKTLELSDDIVKARKKLQEYEDLIKNEIENKSNYVGGGVAGLTEMPNYKF